MFGIKIYCRTLFIVFLFGCSSAPKKVIDAPQKSKRPAWLSAPGTYCLNNELCAVVEGAGRLISESNARKELAKIFKVEIVFRQTIDKKTPTDQKFWSGPSFSIF